MVVGAACFCVLFSWTLSQALCPGTVFNLFTAALGMVAAVVPSAYRWGHKSR